jgi:hypothetical protein
MRAARLFSFLCLLLCLAVASHARLGKTWTFEAPYVMQGTGMGGGATAGAIAIRSGTAGIVASRALLSALQLMGFSVVKPKLELNGALPPRKDWQTDISVLAPALIDDYNIAHETSRLPPAEYGVRYSGRFDVEHGRFRYLINAELFQRGALSKWSRVRDDRYFGKFFVDSLAEQVESNLRKESIP